ncbi:MAG: hypothetical protein ACKVQR_06310 [Aquabacterium sp.]
MPRTRKTRVLSAVLFGTLLVSGCSLTDPYERSATWRPSRVNDANIAAQVANPADLTQGRGDAGTGVRTATGAVERMWEGPAKKDAPSSGLTGIGGGATQQPPR